jgi:hypothetical protein
MRWRIVPVVRRVIERREFPRAEIGEIIELTDKVNPQLQASA